MVIAPSQEQQAIIDAVTTSRVIGVLAYAGTGKSTTLRMVAEAYPDKKFLYVVYNKSQQEEASKKMPSNVDVRTGDSLAWVYVNEIYRQYGKILSDRLVGNGPHYLIKSKDIAEYFGIQRYPITKTIKGEKGSFDKDYVLTIHQTIKHIQKAIEKFCSSEDTEININHFDTKVSYPPEAVWHANKIWENIRSLDGRMKIDFSHIAKLWASKHPDLSYSDKDVTVKYDTLMIDEAQDTNPVFGKVYRSQEMQRIYVGDSYQSIYGFRGAGDELEKIKADAVLSLTASYRFGPKIAEYANEALEKMNAPEKIVGLGQDPVEGATSEYDVVLCRTNAGVIKAIFAHLEQGRKVQIKATYAKELLALLNTIAWFWGYTQERPKLHSDLEGYESKEEIEEAIEEGDESQMVLEVLELLKSRGYDFLKDALSELNAKTKKDHIEITTAHKSKGSEWESVCIWNDFRGPREDYETGGKILPSLDELKLGYVAITRAKNNLIPGSLKYLITKEDEDDEEEEEWW